MARIDTNYLTISPLSCKLRVWQRHQEKWFRKGVTLKQIMKMFPDDATAEAWFSEQFWPNGVCCPCCGSVNVQTGCKHKTMPFRCREKECGKKFSTKTGTIMEGSKIGFQDWLIATFLLTTFLKSVSSMKLHRDLGITPEVGLVLSASLESCTDL